MESEHILDSKCEESSQPMALSRNDFTEKMKRNRICAHLVESFFYLFTGWNKSRKRIETTVMWHIKVSFYDDGPV